MKKKIKLILITFINKMKHMMWMILRKLSIILMEWSWLISTKNYYCKKIETNFWKKKQMNSNTLKNNISATLMVILAKFNIKIDLFKISITKSVNIKMRLKNTKEREELAQVKNWTKLDWLIRLKVCSILSLKKEILNHIQL